MGDAMHHVSTDNMNDRKEQTKDGPNSESIQSALENDREQDLQINIGEEDIEKGHLEEPLSPNKSLEGNQLDTEKKEEQEKEEQEKEEKKEEQEEKEEEQEKEEQKEEQKEKKEEQEEQEEQEDKEEEEDKEKSKSALNEDISEDLHHSSEPKNEFTGDEKAKNTILEEVAVNMQETKAFISSNANASEETTNTNNEAITDKEKTEAGDLSSDDDDNDDNDDDNDDDDDDNSSSSSDESDEEDISDSVSQEKETQLEANAAIDIDNDEDDAIDGPIKSVNEVEEKALSLPDDYKIPENAPIERIGEITGIVENSIIIKAKTSGEFRILKEGSIFCFEDRQPIGPLFEIFGRVQSPVYSIKFSTKEETEKFKDCKGKTVCYVVTDSQFLYTDTIKHVKGTDASNCYDEELLEEEQEFSDDESELAAKQARKKKRKNKDVTNLKKKEENRPIKRQHVSSYSPMHNSNSSRSNPASYERTQYSNYASNQQLNQYPQNSNLQYDYPYQPQFSTNHAYQQPPYNASSFNQPSAYITPYYQQSGIAPSMNQSPPSMNQSPPQYNQLYQQPNQNVNSAQLAHLQNLLMQQLQRNQQCNNPNNDYHPDNKQ
ncbi:hypothetical protein KGF56_001206 [Candida oxycetoniae]|uniref:H/ACA ribonucleoprotein complex non-core subunit NAF1 n=1 Tax=Candida oxycetoniae TaxID=497107 RepID=A0AAI9T058_9ASCO|nr:uncharacterized protein KGF56_001206 [Candida oxycetoniae]KAI3405987.2 hypothetical protein KGF56_001206 [Candida oxycetoniae]